VIEGSSRVYFAGDTGLFPEMADLGEIDLALLPVGGWGPWLRGGHLDADRAAEALTRIRPAHVLPIHWGTFWPVGLPRGPLFAEAGARFASAAEHVTNGTRAQVAHAGQVVDLAQLRTGRVPS
jgi:L-ascorbate metabolism protein UlaG (beta-lactamase superfamily)